MAYLGRGIENLSDRVVLDSLTASATASYTLQLNSVNFVPSSAESLTVSLNGVIQAPISSYTVSGSTLTFSSALTSSDSIDFIIAERGITLQTPSAGSVGTSQLASSAVTTAKIADDAVTQSKLIGHNYPAFSVRPNADQTISTASFTKMSFQTENFDTDNAFDNSTNYRFTVPTGKAGKYFFNATFLIRSNDNKMYISYFYKNGSRVDNSIGKEVTGGGASSAGATSSLIVNLAEGDYMEYYVYHSSGSNKDTYQNYSYFAGYRIGD